MKPVDVIICSNGMVMVFDSAGEQIPELQGNIFYAMQALLNADLSDLESITGDGYIKPALLREHQESVRNPEPPSI